MMSQRMIKAEREPRDFEMTAWNEVPFEKLLIESRDGEWGLGEPTVGHQLCEVIRGTDFAGLHSAGIELPKRWIPDHIVDRKKLLPGDIVLETAGGTAKQSTGRSALLTNTFFEKHKDFPVLCASFSRHLRLDTRKFDSGFIYYLLQALHSAGYMAVYHLQHTGVARFQYTSFKKKTVLNIPDKHIQRRVSAALSAYDDLIESNRRRIELLEQMAEELYREWFVRFRFPGYQQAKFDKGSPSTWQKKKFGEFCGLKRGYDLPEAQIEDGRFPIIASTSIKAFHSQFKVEPPVICTGRSGSLGTVLFVNERAWPLNTALYVQKFYGNSPYLIYFTLKNMGLASFNSGAGVPSLNRNHLNGISIAVPDKPLQQAFDKHVSVLFEQKEQLVEACKSLQKARDALLTRLISGKLPVDQLDIQFPPSMREADAARQEVAHA